MLFSPRPPCEWRESQVLNPGLTLPEIIFPHMMEGPSLPSFAVYHNFLLNVAPVFAFQIEIAILVDQHGNLTLRQNSGDL